MSSTDSDTVGLLTPLPAGVRGPLLIVALALLWGSNFAWIKVSLDAFTPAQITFGRMLLGASRERPGARHKADP